MPSASMKDVIVRLWPTEAIPDSYFGLVRRLVDAVPRINNVKGWSCWKYALEAIIKWLLLYFLVHAIIVLSGNRDTRVNT